MGKRRFAGSVTGDGRTDVSRYGRTIDGHIRGWDIGVRVECFVDSADNDCFDIYVTAGSNDDGNVQKLGTLIEGTGWVPESVE
jgi:hypothetical protein